MSCIFMHMYCCHGIYWLYFCNGGITTVQHGMVSLEQTRWYQRWDCSQKNKEQSKEIVEDRHHYWGCESRNIVATECGGWKCSAAVIPGIMQIRITGRRKNTGSQF